MGTLHNWDIVLRAHRFLLWGHRGIRPERVLGHPRIRVEHSRVLVRFYLVDVGVADWLVEDALLADPGGAWVIRSGLLRLPSQCIHLIKVYVARALWIGWKLLYLSLFALTRTLMRLLSRLIAEHWTEVAILRELDKRWIVTWVVQIDLATRCLILHHCWICALADK